MPHLASAGAEMNKAVHTTAHPAPVGALEAALASLILSVAVLTRWQGLDLYTGSYPEGIRAEQLLLMAHGFRPLRDIFSDQGPWLLQVLYPGYILLGGTLVAVRITVVVASIVGLLATSWVARQASGRWAGLTALLLLTLSPIYLQFSRISVAELLAVAPATLALGCAVRRRAGGNCAWLFAASILFAASLLIKPITLGTAPALALTLGPRRWRDLLLLAGTTGLVVTVGILIVGWNEVVQDIIQFRTASRGVEGWSLAVNLSRSRRELASEGPLLLALSGLGLLLALARPTTWPVALWLVGSTGLILLHAPLHSKHFAVVVVPVAALAGLAAGKIGSLVSGLTASRRPLAGLAGSILLLAVALASTWWFLRSDPGAQDFAERDGARVWYADAIDSLRRVLAADEYVVTDHAYLAWSANRLIPPGMVEASATRVRAGSLTDAMAITQTEEFGARAVLLWADKLVDLKRYRNWLTERYVPAKVWAVAGDTRPVLWLRNDASLATARESLGVGLHSTGREFGDWRLISSRVTTERGVEPGTDALRPGESLSVHLHWQANTPTPADAQVVLAIAGEGSFTDDEREPLLKLPSKPTWLFWVGQVRLPATDRPRSYTITAGLLDDRGHALGQATPVGRVTVAPS
jgi:hypothetical protein